MREQQIFLDSMENRYVADGMNTLILCPQMIVTLNTMITPRRLYTWTAL